MFWPYLEREKVLQKRHRAFVDKWIAQGRRPKLAGGGLIRSAGGWENIKALRREKVYQRSDERTLGDEDFVTQVLAETEEIMESRHALRASGFSLKKVADRVSKAMGIKPEEVWAKGKYPKTAEARSLFRCWSVRELGLTMASPAHELGLSIPAISNSAKKGEQIWR